MSVWFFFNKFSIASLCYSRICLSIVEMNLPYAVPLFVFVMSCSGGLGTKTLFFSEAIGMNYGPSLNKLAEID
jgi:hypothetical protein